LRSKRHQEETEVVTVEVVRSEEAKKDKHKRLKLYNTSQEPKQKKR